MANLFSRSSEDCFARLDHRADPDRQRGLHEMVRKGTVASNRLRESLVRFYGTSISVESTPCLDIRWAGSFEIKARR